MDYYGIMKEMIDDNAVLDNSGPIHYKGRVYAITTEIKEIKKRKEQE
jgi:hypothetical protein